MIKQSEWPEQIVKYVTSQATFDETSGDQQTLAIFSTVLDLIDYNWTNEQSIHRKVLIHRKLFLTQNRDKFTFAEPSEVKKENSWVST